MKTTRMPSWRVAPLALALAAPAAAQCPTGFDWEPGPDPSRPSFIEPAFGQEIYFQWLTTNEGLELFKWSPAGGLTLVADVKPGPGYSRPEQMAAVCTPQGPRILFQASETGINKELWITDGTPGGHSQLAEIRPGSSGSLPYRFTEVDNLVFFVANDGSTGYELWITDCTSAGTRLVKDIRAGSNSNPHELVALNGLLLFVANDGAGDDLWVSDGTGPGTVNLGAAVTALTLSNPYQLTRSGDFVFFLASDSITGEELWKTDGTVGGTTLVSALRQDLSMTFGNHVVAFRDGVIFSGRKPGTGSQLLISDGTAGGTRFIADNPFDAVTSSTPVVVSGDRAFFAGSYFSTGMEVYVTDGTDAGTTVAAETQAGGASGAISNITAVGNGVVFSGNDGVNGQELWFTDGDPLSARMLCDINPSGDSSPKDIHVVGGQLFFQATAPGIGTEPHVIATPGAHVEPLGGSSAPDRPTLVTRDGATPVLGTTVDLVADGPANHVGFLYVAFPQTGIGPLTPLMQSGCNWIGLFAGGGAVGLAGTSTPNLTYPLAIPNDAAFEGFQLHLQSVWINLGAIPPVQLSDALLLVLDQGGPH